MMSFPLLALYVMCAVAVTIGAAFGAHIYPWEFLTWVWMAVMWPTVVYLTRSKR